MTSQYEPVTLPACKCLKIKREFNGSGRSWDHQLGGSFKMINKLILPAVATVLLSGCMTGYNYRHARGAGDYYYGQPSVDYRYHGSPYGRYGYGPYGYGSYGYRGYYGYGGYGYPYYPGYYWRPHPDYGDHDDGDHEPRPDNDNPPPWRDLGDLRMRKSGNTPPQRVAPTRSAPQVPRRVVTPRPTPRPSIQAPRSQSRGDSRMERMINSARRGGRDSDAGERKPPL